MPGVSVSVNTPPNPAQYHSGKDEDADDDDDAREIGIEGTARAGAEELDTGTDEDAADDDDGWEMGIEGTARAGAEELAAAGQAVATKNMLGGVKEAVTLNLDTRYKLK